MVYLSTLCLRLSTSWYWIRTTVSSVNMLSVQNFISWFRPSEYLVPALKCIASAKGGLFTQCAHETESRPVIGDIFPMNNNKDDNSNSSSAIKH